jgi:hypothetical protein
LHQSVCIYLATAYQTRVRKCLTNSLEDRKATDNNIKGRPSVESYSAEMSGKEWLPTAGGNMARRRVLRRPGQRALSAIMVKKGSDIYLGTIPLAIT